MADNGIQGYNQLCTDQWDSGI